MSTTTATYSYAQNSTQTTTSAYTYFYTTTDITINSIKIASFASGANGGSYSLSIRVNNTTLESHTVNVPHTEPGEKVFVDVAFSCFIPAGTAFQIYRTSWTGGAAYYYSNILQVDDWGHTGNSITVGTTDCCEMEMNITLEQIWTIDTSNENYPRLTSYYPPVFEYFSKDAITNLPYNWSVWKFNDYNENYPWIVSFDITDISSAGILIKGTNAWEEGRICLFENGAISDMLDFMIF